MRVLRPAVGTKAGIPDVLAGTEPSVIASGTVIAPRLQGAIEACFQHSVEANLSPRACCVEGHNVAIEYCSKGHYDPLPALLADFVRSIMRASAQR
jgi:hypothetical protein